MSLQGYKIYWGYSADSLIAIHPTNAIYNSPIMVTGGSVTNYTFPSDFWDAATFDSTSIFFSIVAYGDDGEGVPSKPVELRKAGATFNGFRMLSVPLDDGNAYTAKQMAVLLNAAQLFVMENGIFTAYDQFGDDGPIIQPHMAIAAIFGSETSVSLRGRGWQVI